MDTLHKIRAVVVLATLALVLTPSAVHAGGFTDTDAVNTIVIAAPWVTLITSLLIPVINGLVTKASTPPVVKGLVLILLNAVSALVTNGMVADGTSAFSTSTLYTALLGCLISGFMYFNIYKPWRMTSAPGEKLADKGIK